PARMSWSYRSGTSVDSLIGTWIVELPTSPLSSSDRERVYVALFRQLIESRVITALSRSTYCLVLPEEDSISQSRLTGLARGVAAEHDWPIQFAPRGCTDGSGMARLIVPRIHPTESGRFVVYPRGDSLMWWPP